MAGTEESAQREPILGPMVKRIPQGVQVPAARGITATVQLRSLGPQPEEWYIVIQSGVCTVVEGNAEKDDLTLEASNQTWSALANRKLDSAWAYMSGQLSIRGDIGLAMQLQSLLSV